MEELKRMEDINMHKRPNIGADDMKEWNHGGLCVESKEENGALMYVPYGIWCNMFDAIGEGANALRNLINYNEQTINNLGDSDAEARIKAEFEYRDSVMKKHLEVLNQIIDIKHEI